MKIDYDIAWYKKAISSLVIYNANETNVIPIQRCYVASCVGMQSHDCRVPSVEPVTPHQAATDRG